MDDSRRALLAGLGLGALALGQPGIARAQSSGKKLVNIFLRGGADGLNLVAPVDDADYRALRANTRIRNPSEGVPGIDEDKLGLSIGHERFFLHPKLTWLQNRYRQAGDVALIHAVGAHTTSRSHFQRQANMESANWGAEDTRGWLARYLDTLAGSSHSPFRGVGIGRSMQVALRGTPQAYAIRSIHDLDTPSGLFSDSVLEESWMALNSRNAPGQIEENVTQVGEALLQADAIPNDYSPHPDASYPSGVLGNELELAARLFKQDQHTGTEAICVDMGGWDTHGNAGQRMDQLVTELNDALEAFFIDLGARADDVTVVVMSEFGRRIEENASGGFDHGSGGVMFVIGGVTGGVYGDWPELRDVGREDIGGNWFRGDLLATTDYRNVLADVLVEVMGLPESSVRQVFPGLNRQTLNLKAGTASGAVVSLPAAGLG